MTTRIPKRILAHVLDAPWAITPEGLHTILRIAYREGEAPEALEARLGRPLDNTRSVSVRDGVATIPVIGPMVRHASLFSAISGATTYEELATDLTAALDDAKVRAIVLHFDSPGGEVTGAAELAAMIRAANDRKPVVAFIEGLGASAAYWLAAAAGDVVVSSTAIVGSIGVRTTIVDSRDALAAKGVKQHEIISSQSPGKAADPATTDGRARIQATVDALAAAFIADVAKYRGITDDEVIADFGGGDVLVGAAAVAAGMADRLDTYEGVLASLASQSSRTAASLRFGAATPAQEQITMTKDSIAAEHPTWVGEWRAEGATAERERLAAIDALPAKGHEALVTAAKKDPAATAATLAQQILTAEATQRAAQVIALKADEEQTKVPGAPNAEAPKSTPESAERERGRGIAARFLGKPSTQTRS